MSDYTHTEEYTMFRKLIIWLFGPTYQTNLDAYIASKNPTSVAEVDYWTREYDKVVWSRGL